MNIQTVKTCLKIKKINQSQLAKLAGVSRQAVSLWFNSADTEINLHSKNLQKLASGLNISADYLMKPLAIIQNIEERKKIEVELLWDRIYPDLEAFVVALISGQSTALARLVQIYGLFQAEKIAGKQVWNKFQKYKNKLPPIYQKQAEILWNLQKNLDLS